MKPWMRVMVGAVLTASAVWTLVELRPAVVERRRAPARAWWS